MNPLSMMRFRNVMSPTFGGQAFIHNPFEPDDPDNSVAPPAFSPEHTASDRLNSIIGTMPVRQNPGILRRLLAGGIGALSGGPEVTQQILNAPYDRAMSDWNAQLKPAENAAALERGENSIARQVYSTDVNNTRQRQADVLRDKQATRRAELTESYNRDRIRQGDEKQAALDKYHNDMIGLQQYRIDHPNHVFDFKGPTVLTADPQTGIITDTKVPTGSLSDLDKINLQHGNKMKEITATGDEARKTEGVKQEGRVEGINLRGEQMKGLQTQKDNAAATRASQKPETAANQQQRWLNNAKQLIREQPNGLGRFIKLDPNDPKGFTIEKKGSYLLSKNPKGPSDAELDQINKFVNDTYPSTSNIQTKTDARDPNAPKEFGVEAGVTKGSDGKYHWTTEHGSFVYDGKGWVKG